MTTAEHSTGDGFGDAYIGLSDEDGDGRWAYGTGFDDPLAGVDTAVPDGIDGAALATYCLMLGDDALIYSQRLQEWVTHAPELEEETALANIALDLLGQARLLLSRAGSADGTGRDEDRLAFFRSKEEFRNVRLVERSDKDFAELVCRLLIFATWRLAACEALRGSRDPVLAAVATSAVKELSYHRDYAARWVIRLGAGTPTSHDRAQAALEAGWPDVDALFCPHPIETGLVGVAVDPGRLRAAFDATLRPVLSAATLRLPDAAPHARVDGRSGRDGVHTEEFGPLLAEMQSVARTHPDATW